MIVIVKEDRSTCPARSQVRSLSAVCRDDSLPKSGSRFQSQPSPSSIPVSTLFPSNPGYRNARLSSCMGRKMPEKHNMMIQMPEWGEIGRERQRERANERGEEPGSK